MSQSAFVVLAEVPVSPEHWEEVVRLSASILEPTLREAGCEAFYQTRKTENPHTLVFFEVFRSRAAFDIHMDAPYTKAFFAGVQGKLPESLYPRFSRNYNYKAANHGKKEVLGKSPDRVSAIIGLWRAQKSGAVSNEDGEQSADR